MKKILLLAFSISTMFNCGAQTIRETLEGVHCDAFHGGVILYGFEGEEGQERKFSITSYDKELNVVNKYSKAISGDVTVLYSYCITYGDHIDVFVKCKPQSYYIKLSSKLEEQSFVLIDDMVKLADKEIIKSSNGIGIPAEGRVERYFGACEKGFTNKRFLNNDLLDFDLKEQSIVRYKCLPNLKLDTYYSKDWETPIEGFKKVKPTGVIYADDKNIVSCLITKGDNKYWDDCIVKLDSKTGKIEYKISTVYPDKEEIFFLSNAFFDPETGKIIAVGQLYKSSFKADMHAEAILVYNKNGELVSSKKIDFSDFNLDLPRNVSQSDKTIIVLNIGKLSNGKYFVITETDGSAKVAAQGGAMTINFPLAYSYFETDEKGNIENNKVQLRDDFKKGNQPVRSNIGKFIVVQKTANDSKQIVAIDFNKGNENMAQQLDDVDFNANTTNYNPNYDEDVYKQFIIDDNHVITFQKFRASNIYQLRTFVIK